MNSFDITPIGKPEQWLREAAASIGLDFSGLTHEITNHFCNHVTNRHGKGAMAITHADFKKIPTIVTKPDMAIIGTLRDGAF